MVLRFVDVNDVILIRKQPNWFADNVMVGDATFGSQAAEHCCRSAGTQSDVGTHAMQKKPHRNDVQGGER